MRQSVPPGGRTSRKNEVLGEGEEGSDAETAAALAVVVLLLFPPGRAGDVKVNPVAFAHVLLQEQRCMNGSTVTLA